MPRGVKGSGPFSKANKVSKPSATSETVALKGAKAALATLEYDAALDCRTPTCKICSAALPAGGQCESCKLRAQRFANVLKLEAELRRCGICKAPSARKSRDGQRMCPLCRKLHAKEQELQKQVKVIRA